jgi:hypothetical protein
VGQHDLSVEDDKQLRVVVFLAQHIATFHVVLYAHHSEEGSRNLLMICPILLEQATFLRQEQIPIQSNVRLKINRHLGQNLHLINTNIILPNVSKVRLNLSLKLVQFFLLQIAQHETVLLVEVASQVAC